MSAPSSAPLSRPLWPAEPALHVPPELLLQAQGIKVVFFDVDGVMTDGGLYIGEHGETLKRFHALDGHGLKLLRQGGVMPAVVTGRDSAALRHRLSSLGITHMRCGTEDKRPAVEALLQELGLDWSQAAAVGDDWPDAPVLRRVALACAPPSAHPEIRALAHVVTRQAAGAGAVREVCDLILVANGHYARLWRQASA